MAEPSPQPRETAGILTGMRRCDRTVNEWIKKSGAFDEVIDFDELTRDPKDPQRLKAEYSDDWLHLNPKGYEAMASLPQRN